ncbi:hypothetical protein [Nocardia sp. XZ_19_385]|uniref:hypothetical protein n=1 Tax=Nocardia sp. XZ_19_385 TaxID=2769488 RepID=UPI00188E4680|nr:hypothetical protein [Nocardia sp. XZ_19_385]
MVDLRDSGEPDDWPSVRPRLRPVLRPVTYGIDQLADSRPLARPAFPFVNELVAVDKPESRAIISAASLERWGVSADEAFAAARENLAAMVHPHDSDGNAILRYVDDGNAYFASWPLVPGWLASFRARYGHRRPVAFMPDIDTLIVVPDVPQLLGRMYEMAEEQYRQSPRSLSPQGYTLDADDNVIPFDHAGPHEQLPAARRARAGLATAEYGTQTRWLSATLEDHYEIPGYDLEPAYIAALNFADLADGPCTVTAWGEDVEYLLPHSDYIAFCRNTESGDIEHLFDVPFATAAEITGLTPIPGLDPPRYEIRSWPTPETLARLEQSAVILQPAG